MATTDYTGKPYTIYRGSHGKLIAATTTIPSLAPNEVLLKITHSGVCFSDLEVFRAGMPPALGHEGVGTVVAVGPAVTTLRIGDRAGGGYHRGSCGRCAYCLRGDDIWCYERRIFGEELGGGGADNGTFGEYYVGVETYVHRIPDAIASEHAAPLQCAGATVYAALMDTVGNAARVGILGIGGLGHLAVQFAAKMGKEVVVFSTSADKETEARGFGATEFYTMDEVDKITAPIEVLVVSGARYPDWSKFLKKEVLARNGTIVPLSAPSQGPLTLNAGALFMQGYHIHSNLVSSRAKHADMLRFAAQHGVKPVVELLDHEGEKSIEAAFAKLTGKGMRYRGVLVSKS